MKASEPAYVKEFRTNEIELTSIVCDKDEFDENIESLRNVICVNLPNKRATDDQLRLLKDHGHLPLCKRGTKTEHLFKKYNVRTDLLSMIVRGKGKELARQAGLTD
jgi:hypothetical protein